MNQVMTRTCGNIFCNPCLITSSTLVSVSVVRTVFATVPSFATTKAPVPRSDIEVTGPLRASKVAVLGEVVWWKSEVKVSLTRGCKVAMLIVDPKLLACWSLTGKAKCRFVRLFTFLFGKCSVLDLSNHFSIILIVSDWISLVLGNRVSTKGWSVCYFN